MPQIGWFEILLIASIAIIIVGPKDFPLMLKKIGSWIGTIKRYFNSIQDEVTSYEKENINFNEKTNEDKDIKKDEH
ncbi:MAG: twin-arginine translocase subunit TatB [Candidatus Pelagibacterales bacterium]|nr:MAG: twin-arginine translocase subunit TatB [Pelagibacterales bacterium]